MSGLACAAGALKLELGIIGHGSAAAAISAQPK